MSGEPAGSVLAQAKINLHLRVLEREESGFHAIETIFHRISLADELSLSVTAAERTIDVDGDNTGPAESNLAYRAASAYAARTGWPMGFRILITKRIPIGAGLGGGSADAAGILRLLDFLAPKPVGSRELQQLAAVLGADVPFLASDWVMARGSRRGDRLSALPPLPQRDVLLITPDFSVATADAYAWLDNDRNAAGELSVTETRRGADATRRFATVSDSLGESAWETIARFAHNDLEPVVSARHPEMASMLSALRQLHPLLSLMSGSGSTVFGVFDRAPDRSALPGEFQRGVRSTATAIEVVQPIRIK